MHWKTFLLLVLSLGTFAWSGDIDQEEVATWLRKLSSDEMKGRKAGSPEALEAAKLIASVFKEAGLKPLDGADSYFQEFNIPSFTLTSSKLSINGKALDPNDFAVRGQESTKITSLEGIRYFKVGENDDPMTLMGQIRTTKGPKLVLLHPKFRSLFDRFAPFLRQPQMGEEEGASLTVFGMSDELEVNQVEIEIEVSREDFLLRNVIGVLPGQVKPEEYIMYSAHYDHIGTASEGEDRVFNGADDDASGTVAVMALAKYFAANSANGTPGRSIMFVAFTGEELGLIGSKHLAENFDPNKLIAGINIEMIGKPSKWGPKHGFITGYGASDLPEAMIKMQGDEPSFHPDPYPEAGLFFRSDNASFVAKGVPVHSISTGQIDKDVHYHALTDEFETLDLDHLTHIINDIVKASKFLVNSGYTPKRIGPGH